MRFPHLGLIRLAVLSAILLGALPLGKLSAQQAPAKPPNIVWINCEDLDPILGCYGDPLADTPNLDALAEDGILYRQAFANSPICAPARSCLITGLYPTAFGSQHLRCEITLPDSIKPFPSLLKRGAGYFVSNYAKTDYNFDPAGIYDYWKKDLAPWRQRKGGEPFFSFFVFGTTHEGPGNFRERYDSATETLSPGRRLDPDRVEVPDYFPDSPKMRELWARYYDLVAALDLQVGEIIRNLKEDGLWEDTIVWFFSDHGHGLPRHKRWLLDSGLRVPLLIRVPDKYRALAAGQGPGSETERLVSFVDFAPTVLSQAGVPIPETMQGTPFLGEAVAEPRDVIFGARDRADDLFELSRAVHDGRWLYIRHFQPQRPWIPGGRIMGNQKEAMAELRRARDAGELEGAAAGLWAPRKPLEEFYDLQSDPDELQNLADDESQAERIAEMRARMDEWIVEHRDTGFLTEAEYHRRARVAGTSIYEMAQDDSAYDLKAAFAAAERAGRAEDPDELVDLLKDKDSGVRYWGAVGYLASEALAEAPLDEASLQALREALTDEVSPSVAIAAAETLCRKGHAEEALPVLLRELASPHPRVALEAARALAEAGEAAAPVAAEIEEARAALEGEPGGRRRYRDFNYASFTGWALEWALIQCGVAKAEDFE